MNGEQPNWERTVPKDESWGGCRACKHFRLDFTCAAYPERIPLIIADGQVDHLVPRPGQVGDTVFAVNEHPTGLALIPIRGAVARGEAWALAALARSPALRAALDAAPAPSAPVR
ncbi:MAG TPA: hypothetical protein VII06_42080 [Chloroflexota bacterium]